MRFSFDSQVITAFVSAALAVVVLTAMTWSVADEASRAGESVAHSHEVLNGLARIRGDTLQIELSSQNFRLSATRPSCRNGIRALPAASCCWRRFAG